MGWEVYHQYQYGDELLAGRSDKISRKMHEPLFQMVKELSESAQGTARTLYECRGWTVHHNTDLWRMAGPVDGASYGLAVGWRLAEPNICGNIIFIQAIGHS